MSVSLKVAARRFLKWNIEGQKHAIPQRGGWISKVPGRDTCRACKIGLVMIGRYGLTEAQEMSGWGFRLNSTLRYGPLIECPITHIKMPHGEHGPQWSEGKGEGVYRAHLGVVVEHLFESHMWGVVKIDEWLSVLAGQGVLVDA